MFAFIRNVLALIGLIAIIGSGYMYASHRGDIAKFEEFDPKALETYEEMADKLIATGNAAEATVWKAQVKEGLTFEEVDQSIKSVATEMNIKGVGELPLGDQVAAMQGKPWRKLNIYLYCNPLTAAKMIDYSDAFSAYLPCRISLLEDKTGRLWLYTLNMDMMIHGGKPLPPELKEEAIGVKKIMQAILERGAKGDF
ncbi:MAG TPA: DUF302 domain-containing protein [Hyphomicrobiaceae bacterium]|nr:DUF302 domain-containing protein [Hyphomicrobiaceae bacterium]